MGRRGPHRTPTATLAARGSARAKYQRKREPQGGAGLPAVPTWLKADGKRLWRKLAPRLVQVGIATDLDAKALGLLCAACDDYHVARRLVKKVGLTATSEKGGTYQHPAVGIRNKAFEQYRKMLVEFGLTPASRSDVAAVAAGNVDDLDAFAASKPALKMTGAG